MQLDINRKKRVLLIFDRYCSGNEQFDIGIGDYIFIQTIKKLPDVEAYPFYLYHEDAKDPQDLYRRLTEAVTNFAPDLIVMSPHFLGSNQGNSCLPDRYFFKKLCRGIPSIFISYDTGNDPIIWLSTGRNQERVTWINYWDGYADIIVHTDCYFYVQSAFSSTKYLSKHICAFTPFDPELPPADSGTPRDIDYAFMGSVYRYRAPFIQALQNLPYKSFIGDGPQTGRALAYPEYLQVLQRSKLAINFSKSWRGDGEQIKVRIWEVLNCGSVLFEQDSRESRRILEPYDCAVFFTEPEDLAQKINHYLQSPELIPEKLKASQRFLTQHNYDAFWRLVFQAAEEVKYAENGRRSQPEMQSLPVAQSWIATLAATQTAWGLKDPAPESLIALVNLANQHQPTKIIDLGTGWGLSLRAWVLSETSAEIVTLDRSFIALEKSQAVLTLDLSRVKTLEQDILLTDFSLLWGASDRVLLYVDVPDQPGVPVIDYLLRTAAPLLPLGSVVAIANLWYSPKVLTPENVQKFWEICISSELDPLQGFTGHYAPYWQGGSVFGDRNVIALMKWVNAQRISLEFDAASRLAIFSYPQKLVSGQINYNPISSFAIQRSEENLPTTKQALTLCEQGSQLYSSGYFQEANTCFEQAIQISPKIGGIRYAQALCFIKLGQLESAIAALQQDLQHPSSSPNAAGLLQLVQAKLQQRSQDLML